MKEEINLFFADKKKLFIILKLEPFDQNKF